MTKQADEYFVDTEFGNKNCQLFEDAISITHQAATVTNGIADKRWDARNVPARGQLAT